MINHCNEIATRIPISFTELLYELHLETPITALIGSESDEAHEILNDYLDEKKDIFANKEETTLLFTEFPVIANIIERIRKFSNEQFMPIVVTNIIQRMLEFQEEFLEKANLCDGEDSGPNEQGEVVTEVWPNNPQHTKNEKFFADKSKDKDEKWLK